MTTRWQLSGVPSVAALLVTQGQGRSGSRSPFAWVASEPEVLGRAPEGVQALGTLGELRAHLLAQQANKGSRPLESTPSDSIGFAGSANQGLTY